MTASRILIVEDERIVAFHLKQQLEQLGYEIVAVAAEGRTALAAIKTLHPDLVLMDLHIDGELDGIETAAAIPPELSIPVIYLTAYSEESMLERARATKPYGYLVKPFSDRDLHATIQMALARHRADAALQSSEQRFRTIFDGVSESILICDGKTGVVAEANGPARSMYGGQVGDVAGSVLGDVIAGNPPYAREDVGRQLGNLMKTGEAVRFEWQTKGRDGHLFWTENIARMIEIGKRSAILLTARDTTDSRNLQEQLRQSQKMEALGLLAGGIAHDFNNLLAVIAMNLESIGARSGADPEVLEMAADALRAADGGAHLVRQLMAYSRKQPLAPVIVDIDPFIDDTIQLLRRTLSASISIRKSTAPGLWASRVDLQQLQNALLNLAVNARDAMPGGGVLTIAAANRTVSEADREKGVEVPAGEYVEVTITDTGAGMAPAVLAKAFEPFFTTKAVGKGSGLGLSMVYGFVKQSGGHISIRSELGHGTAIELFLPRALAHSASPVVPEQHQAARTSVGKVVLVIEDNTTLRKLVTKVLVGLGLRVLEAEDGPSAARILQTDSPIDLLLSDVVLPNGLGGPEIARYARQGRPKLKILFMSGYARDALADSAAVSAADHLITKPFRNAELVQKVREVLDEPDPA